MSELGELTEEAAAYLVAVRQELSDLAPDEVDELVSDLGGHLIEVAIEAEGPLLQRLGPPGAYAAELRASAGLGATTPRQKPTTPEPEGEATPGAISAEESELPELVREPVQTVLSLLHRLRSGRVALFVQSYAPELVPAWWVARGWLASLAVALVWGTPGVPVSAIGGSRVLGLAVLIGLVLGSVQLGRGTAEHSGRRRVAMLAAGAVVAFGGLVALAEINDPVYYAQDVYADNSQISADGLYSDGGAVSNLFVYDSEGTLLRNVFVYDQDGRAMVIGAEGRYHGGMVVRSVPADANGAPVLNAYPATVRPVIVDPNSGRSFLDVAQSPPAVVIPRLAADGGSITLDDPLAYDGTAIPAEPDQPIDADSAPLTTSPAPTGPSTTGPSTTGPSTTGPETTIPAAEAVAPEPVPTVVAPTSGPVETDLTPQPDPTATD